MCVVTKESNPELYNTLFKNEISAKEMFENLGFDCSQTQFEIFYFYEIRTYGDDTDYLGIHFNLDDKDFWSDVNINVEELQAINKQVEELGWSDNNE